MTNRSKDDPEEQGGMHEQDLSLMAAPLDVNSIGNHAHAGRGCVSIQQIRTGSAFISLGASSPLSEVTTGWELLILNYASEDKKQVAKIQQSVDVHGMAVGHTSSNTMGLQSPGKITAHLHDGEVPGRGWGRCFAPSANQSNPLEPGGRELGIQEMWGTSPAPP